MANDQQHVNYIGLDGKLHELVYFDSEGWKHNILSDLAKATGADDQNSLPAIDVNYSLDGYATPWNGQQHVTYIGQDGKVHELVYSDNGGWKHNVLNDLAKATGADDQSSLPSGVGLLDGYATPWNSQQHLNYIGQDGKVHELVYSDSGGWRRRPKLLARSFERLGRLCDAVEQTAARKLSRPGRESSRTSLL